MWFIHHPYVRAWQYRKLMPICPDEKVGTRYEVAYVREMNKGEHCEVFFPHDENMSVLQTKREVATVGCIYIMPFILFILTINVFFC